MKEIDAPYRLSEAQIRFYRDHGFVRLKGVFSPEKSRRTDRRSRSG